MELAIGEGAVLDADLIGVAAHVGQRDARRFLHHVAELTRQHQAAALAGHRRTLDEEHVAAGAGDRQAGGDAGHRRPRRRLLLELRPSERLLHRRLIDDDLLRLVAQGHPRRGLAQHLAQLAFELPDARLARVVADDAAQQRVLDGDVLRHQAVAFHLPRPEIAAGDVDLLVGRVAVEADHFHPVEQRPRDVVGHVGGGDEHHVRQVERHVQVVILEVVVLRPIEHLEQRRRRIAAPVVSQLVDLVEQDHRVHRAGVTQGADQPPRQRADVGAPVAADLGLVADAAERHPHELAAGRLGDRLANGGLARARRADERQDRARALVVGETAILAQLAHGQVPVIRVLTSSRPEWSASSTSRAFCGSMTSSDRVDQGTASSQSR